MRIAILTSFLFVRLLAADYCYFTPPKDWDPVDPNIYSSRVKISFAGKTKKDFRPSLNLAVEENVDVSMNDYIAAVRKIHQADPNNRSWRDLGKYTTCAGEARLTEIESKTEVGAARLLQLILIKDKTAYVVTATALKEEFSRFYKEFEATFHSLTVMPNLIEAVPDPKKRADLRALFEKTVEKDQWNLFQEYVTNNYKEMGAYWQILMLKSALEKWE